MDRVESVALPYLNSPNYNYGTAIASTSTGNEIFENVMKQATISSMLNDESQGQGTASGGTEETSEQDDSSRYSEDLRKAWETLRAQEDAFYRTSQAARAARKPLTNTAGGTFSSTASASSLGASASSAASTQTISGVSSAGSSGTVTADTPYEVSADGTVTMEQIFQKAAAKYGVSSNLLKAVAKVESGYQPGVVSSAGAIGVMQLMPGTASSLGVTNAYDAEQNIMGGAKLLSQLLAQYNNNLDLALAAYNAGPGNVAKYGGAPPYTQKYIANIKAIMNSGEQTINVPVTISSASKTEMTAAASAASIDTLTGQSNTDAALTALSSLRDGSSSSLASLLGNNSSSLSSLLGSNTSSLTSLLSSLGSSGDGDTLGNLAKLAELQTLNSAASTFSSFGSDDDDNSLI